MAITLLTVPQRVTPVYNPVVFRLSADTADYQQQGYKYWMKIQITDSFTNPTYNKVYDDFITPNQYGEAIIDYSKILQSFITAPDFKTIDLPATGPLINQKWNNVLYKISYGYEKYVTYSYQNTTLVTINNKAYVKLNNTSNNLLFVNGDQINITPDNPTQNEVIKKISGIHSVVSATTSYVIIDVIIPAGTTLPTSAGVIEYADARKVKQITSQPEFIYQGVASVFGFYNKDGNDFKNYDWRLHVLTYREEFLGDWLEPFNNNTYMASSVPQSIYIIKNERPTFGLNLFNYQHSNIKVITRTLDNTASVTRYYSVTKKDNLFTNVYLPLTSVSTTKDMEMIVYDENDAQMFRPIIFRQETKCLINNYVLQFLDRRGGLSTFGFGARAYVNGSVTKKDYNKYSEEFLTTTPIDIYGAERKYQSNTYGHTYTYDDAGKTQIDISETVEMELNTLNQQWSDEQNELWEELITSPYVYLITDGNYAKRVNVQVKTLDYNTNTLKNKRLTSKKIKIEFSNKNNINI